MHWFGNLRVGGKLAVLVVAVLLVFMLTSVMAFRSLATIDSNVDTMYQWMLIPIVSVEDAVTRYLELSRLVLELETGSQAAVLQDQADSHNSRSGDDQQVPDGIRTFQGCRQCHHVHKGWKG